MRTFLTCWLVVVSVAMWSCDGFSADPTGYDIVDLWPGTGDHAPESGDRPQLWIGGQLSKEATAAIVILPGGGYGGLAIDHEGYQIADWMQSLGIRAAIIATAARGMMAKATAIRYRCKTPNEPFNTCERTRIV